MFASSDHLPPSQGNTFQSVQPPEPVYGAAPTVDIGAYDTVGPEGYQSARGQRHPMNPQWWTGHESYLFSNKWSFWSYFTLVSFMHVHVDLYHNVIIWDDCESVLRQKAVVFICSSLFEFSNRSFSPLTHNTFFFRYGSTPCSVSQSISRVCCPLSSLRKKSHFCRQTSLCKAKLTHYC